MRDSKKTQAGDHSGFQMRDPKKTEAGDQSGFQMRGSEEDRSWRPRRTALALEDCRRTSLLEGGATDGLAAATI
jgi:hypothetical protein